jgi:rhamnogalacturonyl hydrolase YesR
MSSDSSGKPAEADPDELRSIKDSLTRLEGYVRSRDYQGADPYDALNSPLLASLPGKLPKVAMTQLFVYSPIDLRPMFSVRESRNPKAVALFLSAYCDMRRSGMIDDGAFSAATDELVNSLIGSRSVGYHGNSWGFNFDWQDITRFSRTGLPTVVVSSFVGNSLLDLYDLTGRRDLLDLASGIIDFIQQDLGVYEDGDGICFSYTPIDRHVVHNASMMAAALMARVSSLTGRNDLLERAARAVDFTVAKQEADGSWAYSIDPSTGSRRMQIDFHQGFVIDSLLDFINYSDRPDPRYTEALRRGAAFYRDRQFDAAGRSLWRLPRQWPADIHHQAQGILTFSRLSAREPGMLELSLRIARWTTENMQDPLGFFYHQRHERFVNRIPYMRWGQAWMMRALASLAAASTPR